MRTLAFDIEIANVFELRPGEDLDRHAPFDVAVAATEVEGGEHRLWYSTGADGRPLVALERRDARALLAYLDEMQRAGHALCAWNGLGFDLQWIGHAAGDVPTASRVALQLYDPMFQLYTLKGFPVSLAAVAAGLGIGLAKTMDAADAPRQWRAGNHQRVLDYVLGDVRMTNAVVAEIARRREVVWVTQRGSRSSVPLPRLKTVAECLREPLPDQSWMSRPIPRERFTRWLAT